MSITSPDDRISFYNPVVATTEFPAQFPVFDNDDIKVFVDGVERDDFAVTATYTEGVSTDAKAVFAVGITGHVQVVGAREPHRTNRFNNGGPLPVRDLNLALDTVESEVQELRRDMGRAVLASYGSSGPALPAPDGNKLIGWNGAGELENKASESESVAAAEAAAEAALAAANAGYLFDSESAFEAANIPLVLQRAVVGIGIDKHDKIRISTPSPAKPWHKQSADGAWWQIDVPAVTLGMLGGTRTYASDNRQAFFDAVEYAQTFDVPVRDCGVYGIVGNVEITGTPVTIEGAVGAPHIWFGTSDDGDSLRPGFKDDIPGLVFIFKNGGTPTSFSLTNRTDDYATVTPCLAVSSVQNTIRRLAIVQDMNVFDASGNYNDIAEVAASLADDFDVGVLVNDTRQNLFDDVTVFGYFSKAGYVVHSKSGDDDPDYNQWIGGSAYGRHGVALIGANDAPAAYGLSGSQFYGVRIGSKDSKARVATDSATAHYSGAADWRCLYIDGDTDGSTAEINGHYFTNCVFRTASDRLIELDHASNVVFAGCIFEHNFYSVPNSTSTPTFIASANTKKGVQFLGCRINYLTMIFHADFVGALAAGIGVFVQGDPIQSRAGWVYSDPNVVGGYAATIVGGDGNVGDPSVQFTKDANNQSAGWKILMDVSAGDPIQFRYAGSSVFDINTTGVRVPAAGERRLIHEVPGALTISGDAITVTRSYHLIATEGGASTDDLVNINGGVAGMRLLLRCSNSGQTITLRRTGNIRLDGSTDKAIATTGSYIELFCDGSLWRQISPVMVTG
ncbi:hypothetical protein SJ05684_c30620 [Sinorhizobium sojae CCBAU 05684]|uniref:Uncharacterized protein n=1 Tax=Sinorhizobium sojae CCBAU 05684 TaxID=716928 RepID=A0A249PF99_9HYPH|nr:hypothetical protein [Sinorhizobium sojae]ASY64486.1 hypothetical protein SJ05684_c30620 [Sinorhizobium sojae CCBAU 05684]